MYYGKMMGVSESKRRTRMEFEIFSGRGLIEKATAKAGLESRERGSYVVCEGRAFLTKMLVQSSESRKVSDVLKENERTVWRLVWLEQSKWVRGREMGIESADKSYPIKKTLGLHSF